MSTIAESLAEGWRLHQSGDLRGAEQTYRQVLQTAPEDSAGWCYLGMACHDQDRFSEAVAAYQRAIAIQPKFPVAFNNLGNTLRLMRRMDESLACFDQALLMKPDYVNAHKNKGTALVWEGRLKEGLASYQKALEYAPADAETHKNLGVIQLLLGDFATGWVEYEWRWKSPEISLPNYDRPLWDGSTLDGRTILLTAEQGLGDTIHFVRYAAALKALYDCRVVVAAPKRLLPLLATCPGIDQLCAQNEPPPPFDVFAPLLNVPGILKHTADDFPVIVPYVSADPALVQAWQEELASYRGYRVGLAWQGNPKHHADRMRSIPLAKMAALGKLQGIHWFSLQKGHGSEQLDEPGSALDLVPLGHRLDEQSGAFMDTAAVLANLDLLITSDTAIAHVAGALGTPVWLALSHVPDWRWLLEREDSPWYPSMRLFRQEHANDWDGVFERMAEQLNTQWPEVKAKQPEDYRVLSCGINRLSCTRYGTMLYNRHDQFIGRSLDRYGEFSQGEADLFQQSIRPGQIVVEAGAHVGSHTLVFSDAVGNEGRVYAFEPQRILFQTLCGNMAVNGRTNAFCRCEALGEQAGWVVVPPIDYANEGNFGGLSLGGYAIGERVRQVTIDSMELPQCHFLKVDVEGMERYVLQGAEATLRRCRPILYVENDRAELSAALIEYILGLDYELYWHLPPLFNPQNFFRNEENVFPSLVSANMLGIHKSVKSTISGLRRIDSPQSDWREA